MDCDATERGFTQPSSYSLKSKDTTRNCVNLRVNYSKPPATPNFIQFYSRLLVSNFIPFTLGSYLLICILCNHYVFQYESCQYLFFQDFHGIINQLFSRASQVLAAMLCKLVTGSELPSDKRSSLFPIVFPPVKYSCKLQLLSAK